MIYIVIPEPFSATEGVALSKIAADFMRHECATVVACEGADESWGLPQHRILVLPMMMILTRLRGWKHVPRFLCRLLFKRMFQPLLKRLGPEDVVWYINGYITAEIIGPSIRATGAKFIYHVQNTHEWFASEGRFYRLAADAIVFLSDAMRREVETQIPATTLIFTVHNGSDETTFWPNPRPANNVPPVVLFVGRLMPYKGAHVLIEAIKLLNERKVPVTCRIVGSMHAAAQNGKVTSYIASLHKNAPPNVSLKGFRSGKEIAEEYRSSDILCCPSVFAEPFGLVNTEAMACGIPVVASRTGGIPEIAAEGGILLCEKGNAEDLAAKLQVLLVDEQLRMRVRMEGLNSFKRRFTSTVAVGGYVSVVARVLARSSVDAPQVICVK